MTRINIIPPSELMDQHLMAEFREILHVPKSLQRTLRSKAGLQKERIPQSYTLNTGHVMFFYNKPKYLKNRHNQLKKELIRRGFNINTKKKFPIEDFPPELNVDWEPKKEDFVIIRKRIRERILEKVNWYRYYKKNINEDFVDRLYPLE